MYIYIYTRYYTVKLTYALYICNYILCIDEYLLTMCILFMTMAQTMQTMCTPKKDECCRIWKSEWFSTQDKLLNCFRMYCRYVKKKNVCVGRGHIIAPHKTFFYSVKIQRHV